MRPDGWFWEDMEAKESEGGCFDSMIVVVIVVVLVVVIYRRRGGRKERGEIEGKLKRRNLSRSVKMVGRFFFGFFFFFFFLCEKKTNKPKKKPKNFRVGMMGDTKCGQERLSVLPTSSIHQLKK